MIKRSKKIFTGRDYYMTIKFKDNYIDERKIFANNKNEAVKIAKENYSGIMGLKRIIKIKPGAKWFREL